MLNQIIFFYMWWSIVSFHSLSHLLSERLYWLFSESSVEDELSLCTISAHYAKNSVLNNREWHASCPGLSANKNTEQTCEPTQSRAAERIRALALTITAVKWFSKKRGNWPIMTVASYNNAFITFYHTADIANRAQTNHWANIDHPANDPLLRTQRNIYNQKNAGQNRELTKHKEHALCSYSLNCQSRKSNAKFMCSPSTFKPSHPSWHLHRESQQIGPSEVISAPAVTHIELWQQRSTAPQVKRKCQH